MADKIELDEEKVIELYHKLKSSYKVAREMKCSVTPISRVLDRNHIKRYGFQGMSGKDNPNYGHKWSRKQKESLANKRRGKSWAEIMGKERAVELKIKFSKKYSGKGNPFYGKKHSKGYRDWSSKKHKGKKISDKQKGVVSKKLRGIPKNHGDKISKFYKQHPNAYSSIRKKQAREKIIETMQSGKIPFINSKPEKKLKIEMEKRGIIFIHQYKFGKFLCDFALPQNKLIVEADGDYFHYNPQLVKKKPTERQLKKRELDKDKKEYCDKKGWTLLRFWECEIKKDVKSCVDKIEETIKYAKK